MYSVKKDKGKEKRFIYWLKPWILEEKQHYSSGHTSSNIYSKEMRTKDMLCMYYISYLTISVNAEFSFCHPPHWLTQENTHLHKYTYVEYTEVPTAKWCSCSWEKILYARLLDFFLSEIFGQHYFWGTSIKQTVNMLSSHPKQAFQILFHCKLFV